MLQGGEEVHRLTASTGTAEKENQAKERVRRNFLSQWSSLTLCHTHKDRYNVRWRGERAQKQA